MSSLDIASMSISDSRTEAEQDRADMLVRVSSTSGGGVKGEKGKAFIQAGV